VTLVWRLVRGAIFVLLGLYGVGALAVAAEWSDGSLRAFAGSSLFVLMLSTPVVCLLVGAVVLLAVVADALLVLYASLRRALASRC
jgi:hypothetical protein